MVRRFRFALLILLGQLWMAALVAAADVRLFVSDADAFRAVVIEGQIEPGDFDAFLRLVRDNQGKVGKVVIFSPGGDVAEAFRIGRAMRALELASQVPLRSPLGQPLCDDGLGGLSPKSPQNCTCASAGFFVHIGGVNRSGTYLAVHRPSYAKGRFGELPREEARKAFTALQDEARVYMREMGVPEHIREDILGTPSERALLLDDRTVRTYFSGPLPYLHEWQRNRCARLTAPELQRIEDLSGRLLKARSAEEITLTGSEWADYALLRKKQDEERACAVVVEHQGRLVAFERYFGFKPSDLDGYDFAGWAAAASYLGRPVAGLVSDGFERSRVAEVNLLERSATARQPMVILSDSTARSGTVSRVSLVSTSEPSPEFTRRLLESLDRAWGKGREGEEPNSWRWVTPGFTALLVRETSSARGAFLNLVVEASIP